MNTLRFLTAKELASAYGVTTRTVYRWVREGTIEAAQPSGKGGHYFVAPEELPETVRRRLKMPESA